MVEAMHSNGLFKPIPFIALAALIGLASATVAIAADLSDPFSVHALTRSSADRQLCPRQGGATLRAR